VNEVLTFHVLSAISLLNSFFLLGLTQGRGTIGAVRQSAQKTTAILKNGSRHKMFGNPSMSKSFLSSFASYGAGSNSISLFFLMREYAVKYILQFQQMLPWQ